MRSIQSALVGGSLLLVALGTGWAQSTMTPVNAQGQTEAEMKATTTASQPADPDASMKAIRERAKNASTKGRALVDKKLTKISSDVDAEATANGKEVAAGRVASEFGMTGEALVAETDQFQSGLGEVIIGHTLMANSTTAVTMDQMFSMRKDGMGWGQIAQGLNLRLGEVVSAVMSEGAVAQGTAKADGKTAMIHSAAATHAGAHAGTSTSAATHVGHTTAGVSGSVGVGAGTKIGK